MMRLDKFLCETAGLSRSEAKQYIKQGKICLNGQIIKTADCKISETADTVTYNGKPLVFANHHYYLLNKPAGVITATEDKQQRTVMDLLTDIPVKNLFPVGRLDKDTEGLLLITDNGLLAHRLLAPGKHVEKTYFVRIKAPLTDTHIAQLSEGIDIGDAKPALPAKVKILSQNEILLTICEGRFHQVKRMLQAVGNEVLYLKRQSMGPLTLPENLPNGAFRPLTEEEISKLKQEKFL